MKLALHKLTQWHHTESYNIALSGPMSPMSAAKDFVSKVFEKGDMVITGLFRIQGDGETTFTTWDNADIEPVQVDVICCILNFRHMAVFGEIGSRYMPIALILDGEAQFSELYTTYKWESAPTVQEIADVLSTINLAELKKQFEDYRWTVKAEQADDWMLDQPMESQLRILGERIPRDALMKWDAMSPQEKYKIYKQWTAK
ncbi:MAG: hypothetical protein J6C81_06475 [Muribaculaceae bacterium]|nr:hypothetical protein [Muribaculaceae bacterium]